MRNRPVPKRPVELAMNLLDWTVIDAGNSAVHKSVFIELPVLVPVRPKPVPRIVVPFIGEANGDAVAVEGPELLDETVVQFFLPLARKKFNDGFSAR